MLRKVWVWFQIHFGFVDLQEGQVYYLYIQMSILLRYPCVKILMNKQFLGKTALLILLVLELEIIIIVDY